MYEEYKTGDLIQLTGMGWSWYAPPIRHKLAIITATSSVLAHATSYDLHIECGREILGTRLGEDFETKLMSSVK